MNAQPSLFDATVLPPHNKTETSRAGAIHAAATGQVQKQERQILWALSATDRLVPTQGLTRKEITQALGGYIPESRVGARVNRLIANGLCREEGTRVPAGGTVKQKVCFITNEGLAALEAKS